MLATVVIHEAAPSEYPPAKEILWVVFVASERRGTIVRARVWYRARELGAEKLGVLFGQVDAVRLDEEPVELSPNFNRVA